MTPGARTRKLSPMRFGEGAGKGSVAKGAWEEDRAKNLGVCTFFFLSPAVIVPDCNDLPRL